jgi:RimJ/RimL family protein N-acetyltransferase
VTIILESFGKEDFPRLTRWIDTPVLLTQWGRWKFKFPLDDAQLDDYLRDTVGEPVTRRVYKGLRSNEVMGHVELNGISPENGTASICRVFVDPERRRKGIAKAMIRQVLRVGFEELGLRRIDLQVYDFNVPALECYERLGFVREGVLRQYVKVGDECWNLVWMAMLREEWTRQGLTEPI